MQLSYFADESGIFMVTISLYHFLALPPPIPPAHLPPPTPQTALWELESQHEDKRNDNFYNVMTIAFDGREIVMAKKMTTMVVIVIDNVRLIVLKADADGYTVIAPP